MRISICFTSFFTFEIRLNEHILFAFVYVSIKIINKTFLKCFRKMLIDDELLKQLLECCVCKMSILCDLQVISEKSNLQFTIKKSQTFDSK